MVFLATERNANGRTQMWRSLKSASCLQQEKYFARVDSAVFGIGQRSPNAVSTLIFEGSSAEILFKGRESLRRGEEVMIEIVGVRRRFATEDRGGVAMQNLERRRFKDYQTV